MKCGYCFRNIDDASVFFSSYIFHIIHDDAEDSELPVFCDEYCMKNWAAIRKNISLEEVKRDFMEFRGVPMKDMHNAVDA